MRLSVPEIRRLLHRLVLAVRPPEPFFVIHWSRFRRRHQAIARHYHYRARSRRLDAYAAL